MKKTVFLAAVAAEIKRIKRRATEDEINKLNFKGFKHWHADNCIYGQMTGVCNSKRAIEIMPKKYDRITADYDRMNSLNKAAFEHQDFNKGDSITALEKYLYMCNKPTHKHIIDFLKGKTDTLVIE
jgi:hypothetical protein